MQREICYVNSLFTEKNEDFVEDQFSDHSTVKDENHELVHDIVDIQNINIGGGAKQGSQTKQILLVDDQEFNLNALEIILQYKLNINAQT